MESPEKRLAIVLSQEAVSCRGNFCAAEGGIEAGGGVF
jgi:hypothetical protein